MAGDHKPTEDEVWTEVAPILAAGLKQRRARLAAEAAEYLGITKRALEGKAYRREIPFVKLSAGTLRFDLRELDRFIDANTTPARER